MAIKAETSAFPIGERLVSLLATELSKTGDAPHRSVVFNFRDPNYSAEAGGYRPVEIRVGDNGGILYITEFSYYGPGVFAELAKSVDFDFGEMRFQNEYRSYPITDHGVHEFYKMWVKNFIDYCEMGVFTVKVSVEECA